jgi:hypothetical protein
MRDRGDMIVSEEYRIPDQVRRTAVFTGRHLAHSDSIRHGNDPPRWVEMDLYRTDAGTYVLDRAGHSRVYHVFDGPCDRGVRVPARRLRPDAVPCPDCHPIPGQPAYDAEETRHEVTPCATAADVVSALVTMRKTGPPAPFLSLPARRLLELAAETDEGIREATLGSAVRIT